MRLIDRTGLAEVKPKTYEIESFSRKNRSNYLIGYVLDNLLFGNFIKIFHDIA